MSFNPKSPHAEKYALCLIQDKKLSEALELFNLIAGDASELLIVEDQPDNEAYVSRETADTYGKLGFEGVFQYANLLLEKNPQRAKKLLLEIAEKIPTDCPPCHLGDVRVAALELLMDLGIHTIKNVPIQKELETARKYQC
jgi:hypothetical protein